MPKLTARTVDAIEPGATDRLTFDSELPGFALKVTAKGTRVFLYQYWSPIEKKKRRRVTIGTLGDPLRRPDGSTVALTATTARAEAERLRGIVKDRRDPFLESIATARASEVELVAARARTAAQQPMRDVVRDFLADATTLGRAPRTVREYGRLLSVHFLPVMVGDVPFADRPAADVGALDADAIRRQRYTVTVTRRVAKAGAPRRAATLQTRQVEHALPTRPVLGNRVQQLGRSLLNFAERTGARSARTPNPFVGARWAVEQETRTALTRDEIGALHGALAALDDGTRGGSVDAIRFLLYSGFRKREALTLRWDAVDADAGTATLGHTKTGRSVRPLSREALAVLAAIPHRGPYVFPAPGRSGRPRESVVHTWNAARKIASIAKPLHSLRHTFATIALSEGVPLATVSAMLGHSSSVTTSRYAHMEGSAARAGADVAGAAIARAMRPADVVPIARRKSSGA